MQLDLVIKLLVLLTMANGTPVIAKKLLGGALSAPVDGGLRLSDGRPLFGPSKTLRGIAVSVIATTHTAPARGRVWTTGHHAGVAALAGDLGPSFIKRRMGRLQQQGTSSTIPRRSSRRWSADFLRLRLLISP
jgi:CDP-2,3-bis-(O-geranylgeranyl)-sn-glycerol synthase